MSRTSETTPPEGVVLGATVRITRTARWGECTHTGIWEGVVNRVDWPLICIRGSHPMTIGVGDEIEVLATPPAPEPPEPIDGYLYWLGWDGRWEFLRERRDGKWVFPAGVPFAGREWRPLRDCSIASGPMKLVPAEDAS